MNKTIIFDLDGTLYFGSQIANEAPKALELLMEANIDWIFLTNNSTKTRKQITDKLIDLGFTACEEIVYTSAYITAQYLIQHQINKVLLLGEESFQEELFQMGIHTVSNPQNAQAIVIGLDFSISYEKIENALYAVNNLHLPIIASNADKNFPIGNQRIRPGANMILSALLGSLDTSIDYTLVGKPNTFFLKLITQRHNLDKNNIIVVGDSMESDIEMAKRYGCDSFLVGSHGFTIQDATNIIETKRG